MTKFSDYAGRFTTIEMRREDGVLEMRFHSSGGPMRYSFRPVHEEMEQAFLAAGRDYENEVIIMTGTGDEFSGPAVRPDVERALKTVTPSEWDPMQWEGRHFVMHLLNIEVPVISVINGPATRHAEIALLADIVLASDDAVIQDSAHFQAGMVPGDGTQILLPLLMGTNRARYFLLTGQILDAQKALEFGLVNEVLPRDALQARAWDLARALRKQPRLVRRFTRMLLTQPLREQMQKLLPLGFALEGLAHADAPAVK